MSLEIGVQPTSRVVVVADIIGDGDKQNIQQRRDLEKSDSSTVEQLLATIARLGLRGVHYQTPEELAKQAKYHKQDLILSIYGGEVSRNRMALVPAICETFELNYIGPDTYGRVIAQDKEVSKRLAFDMGLETPKWLIIRRIEDIQNIKSMSPPVVVKPSMEGSSIGISQSNLCHTLDEAIILTMQLLSTFEQPILVEQFIAGKETALSVIETNSGFECAYSEIWIPDDPDYFSNRLFDAEEKTNPSKEHTARNIDHELSTEQLDKIKTFLKAFGHFGYCRVDGKHIDGKFHFLEITPDAWIDKKGQFSMAFTEKGWTYDEVINAILLSARKAPLNQLTND